MSRIDDFKKRLAKGELKTLNSYESAIENLFEDLDNDGFIIKSYLPEKVERLQKLSHSSYVSAGLFNEFNKIFLDDKNRTDFNLYALSSMGFNIIPDHYGALLTHNYQVITERFKSNLIATIDFKSIGVRKPEITALGGLMRPLKTKFPRNKFINYFDSTSIRNAVTHYTYFFENGKLYLCDGQFDTNPSEISLVDFMKVSKKLNILTESFFIIYLDKFFPGGSLKI